MGSVKDLVVLKKPTRTLTGTGLFVFSDRYSVFDWGEMPNHISQKGKALCLTGAYFFEKLESLGLRTHYLGVMEDGVQKKLFELEKPTDVLKIKLLRVMKPKVRGATYDYSAYQKVKSNFLIPLEIVYRNSLPAGSSVFKRLKNGSLKLSQIGLRKMPVPAEKLEKPIFEISTKLEATDRYVDWAEAQKIASLSDEELAELKAFAMRVNEAITAETQKVGIINEDGKLEFGFDEMRNLMLVDVVGTPDECRFTYCGIHISKEVARMFYRGTDWFREVENAKKKNISNWKTLVKLTPPPLPEKLEKLISKLYLAVCNEITHRDWFETEPLENIVAEIKELGDNLRMSNCLTRLRREL